MINIPGGNYYTVEQFRQRCGFKSAQPIYRAINSGRLVGIVKAGDIYLIPQGSVIVDDRLKGGRSIRVNKFAENA